MSTLNALAEHAQDFQIDELTESEEEEEDGTPSSSSLEISEMGRVRLVMKSSGWCLDLCQNRVTFLHSQDVFF